MITIKPWLPPDKQYKLLINFPIIVFLIGIILRWGFLINFCVVSSFTTFRPNFTSGLLQMIYYNLIIPIRGHGKSPEEGQSWNLAET